MISFRDIEARNKAGDLPAKLYLMALSHLAHRSGGIFFKKSVPEVHQILCADLHAVENPLVIQQR